MILDRLYSGCLEALYLVRALVQHLALRHLRSPPFVPLIDHKSSR